MRRPNFSGLSIYFWLVPYSFLKEMDSEASGGAGYQMAATSA